MPLKHLLLLLGYKDQYLVIVRMPLMTDFALACLHPLGRVIPRTEAHQDSLACQELSYLRSYHSIAFL